MRIGIIGGGNIGLAFAKTLSRAGIAATIANSRGLDSLNESLAALGPTIRPGTREQAAAADIVLIAVNWTKAAIQSLAAFPSLPNVGLPWVNSFDHFRTSDLDSASSTSPCCGSSRSVPQNNTSPDTSMGAGGSG